MSLPQPTPNTQSDPATPHQLILQPLRICTLKQAPELIKDFFSWLANEWGQPVIHPDVLEHKHELLDRFAFRSMAPEGLYTYQDLVVFSGLSRSQLQKRLSQRDIHSAGNIPKNPHTTGHSGKYLHSLFRGKDIAELVSLWDLRRLLAIVSACWDCFSQPSCGMCKVCLRNPPLPPINCTKNQDLIDYRSCFVTLLKGLVSYGSIASWWQHEQANVFAPTVGAVNHSTGLILLYLLDRHFLALSIRDLMRLPLPGMDAAHLLRPWQRRYPEEYASFRKGLAIEKVQRSRFSQACSILGLLVLLRYGFSGLAELERRLSPEEIEQALQERRLLTLHLTQDVYLPFTVGREIQVGHLVLDEVRYYIWSSLAEQTSQGLKKRGTGPRSWNPDVVQMLERILAAKIWWNDQSLLSLRPETSVDVHNPFALQQRCEPSVALLPKELQDSLYAYITYRYQEQHRSLTHLVDEVGVILHFLAWARKHAPQEQFPLWGRNKLKELVENFISDRYQGKSSDTKCHTRWLQLRFFFHTLATLDLPYPSGYRVLDTNPYPSTKKRRTLPREDVLDRVFQDGVRQLDRDPFARLALTIQYYCGTRVRETCELPVLAVAEDRQTNHAALLIPRGKTNKERFFPIAPEGMGPLTEYMEQVVKMQLTPEGKYLHQPRLNQRYLEEEPEKATEWYYLFDQTLHRPPRRGDYRRVLSPRQVNAALDQALILAAKRDPSGLFDMATYSLRCCNQRRQGQHCFYFSSQDGITICPICGGSLPGYRGHLCQRNVAREFHCNGEAAPGEYFCPKCDAPLAKFIDISTHTFRHNSVTRAHRLGVSVMQNMFLHGQESVSVHIQYLHLLSEQAQQEVRNLFAEKQLELVVQEATGYSPGQMIQDGISQTASLTQYLGATLRRSLRRRTYGLWGGFWVGALAAKGTSSPMGSKEEIVLPEDTYEYAVAQYRYEALGLAVSEVALERGTKGKFHANVAPFLNRQEIEQLVKVHLEYVKEYLRSPLGIRLMEGEIEEQRRFLERLANMLRTWWEPLGSITELVIRLLPEGLDVYHAPEPPTESAS